MKIDGRFITGCYFILSILRFFTRFFELLAVNSWLRRRITGDIRQVFGAVLQGVGLLVNELRYTHR